jgi:toxin ParE1/3/4
VKLIFSDRAVDDLEQIGHYIRRDAPEAARRHIQRLIDRVRQVVRFPNSGRVVPEFQESDLREVIEGNYRIVYEVNDKKKTITVITIFESHHLLAKKSK